MCPRRQRGICSVVLASATLVNTTQIEPNLFLPCHTKQTGCCKFAAIFASVNEPLEFQKSFQDGKFQSRLLDVFAATTPEPIRAMAISRQNKMLYVSSDSHIKQVWSFLIVAGSRIPSFVKYVRNSFDVIALFYVKGALED